MIEVLANEWFMNNFYLFICHNHQLLKQLWSLPQMNQTHLMEATLDNKLFSRSMMRLKEQTGWNFFSATDLLRESASHRDTLLFPQVIQAWEFTRKYITNSDRLNWDSEAECRAMMRDVLAAAEDCCIGSIGNFD